MKIKIQIWNIAILTAVLFTSCSDNNLEKSHSLKVVCTTSMITDLASEIGGDKIQLDGLMRAGVDPHLYKASEGDVLLLGKADVILYNGLHLEGKLEDVFEKMKHRNINAIALSDCLNKKDLISSENFASNYDPHIWFNINYWIQIAEYLSTVLESSDPDNAEYYKERTINYVSKLKVLENEVSGKVNEIEVDKRILVTAHDAFSYFGKEYNFKVVGLQGLSTATEAGVKDVQNLVEVIIENEVKSIFVESSVPIRTIEAVKEAVLAKGKTVEIGGTLYSDALGDPKTKEGTYIGMFKHNVNTILTSIK